jgi:hypothetical protein
MIFSGGLILKLYTKNKSLVCGRGFNRRIAVDFDGCCAPIATDLRIIGPPLPGAEGVLSNLRELGYYIVIWTSRVDTYTKNEFNLKHGTLMHTMLKWLEDYDFPFDEIYLGYAKPPCKYFVDDRAFSFLEDASEASWESIFTSILKHSGKEWK